MTAIEGVLLGIAVAGHVFAISVTGNALVECATEAYQEAVAAEQTIYAFDAEADVAVVVTD